MVLVDSRRCRGCVAAEATIGRDGTFRSVVALRPARYTVEIRAELAGDWYSGSATVELQAGTAYDISGVLSSGGFFTLFPVSSY